jgi:maltose alpha-D-glucosyltransferase/alpha-amylase
MFDVVDYWLSMGVDGLRLDAVPYLFAREGTSCENLPETFAFLRDLRSHVDKHFPDRMLLAEANQWPEDAIAYMGDGDTCHMAFHFPLMPRMFMAARQEDRFPMVDILAETPSSPPECQWALFLRNHDELTLEMVTDEERDYMYRAYAQDPQARVNVGIRRRLAPLLGNDRKLIEMMNGLLFSMPGTPILYYGDEIGMGDNIYLGDRNAVRTPMQWDGDRNAGFSSANPQRLYLPLIIDPEYHTQAVNVEAQEQNPSSLLWWMKRLISLRQRYQAFGRGSLELLRPDNRKVFAFIRRFEEERILVVVNLSRNVQCAELDLSEFRGAVPVELFGNMEFPPIGDLPYFITLGPHGFYWFSLECEPDEASVPKPVFRVPGEWDSLFTGTARRQFEAFLPLYISSRRWFGQKARGISAATILDAIAIPSPTDRRGAPIAYLLITELEMEYGSPEHYTLSFAFDRGANAEEIRKWRPEAVVADLYSQSGPGILYDAMYEPEFGRQLALAMTRRRSLPGEGGRLYGQPTTTGRRPPAQLLESNPVPMSAEQSNSSVVFDEVAIAKLIRRFEEGTNPGIELGVFLGERAHFAHAPRTLGSLEYRSDAPGSVPATIAVLEEFVPNEGDGWTYVVDALAHGLEEALAHRDSDELLRVIPPADIFSIDPAQLEPGHPLVGPHLEWARLLGQRTAELHRALASDHLDPEFVPEPLTAMDRQALYHGARSLTRQVLHEIRQQPVLSPAVEKVIGLENDIIELMRTLSATPFDAARIRCHGDFHLGQVLWTGKDFVIIDFEGEPTRSLSRRRLKRPAAVDLAGMVRSMHYAARAAALRITRDLGKSVALVNPALLDDWLTFWHRWVSATFIESYLEGVPSGDFLPLHRGQFKDLMNFFLLEKAIYELSYEVNSRPTWTDIPARGILDILSRAL